MAKDVRDGWHGARLASLRPLPKEHVMHAPVVGSLNKVPERTCRCGFHLCDCVSKSLARQNRRVQDAALRAEMAAKDQIRASLAFTPVGPCGHTDIAHHCCPVTGAQVMAAVLGAAKGAGIPPAKALEIRVCAGAFNLLLNESGSPKDGADEILCELGYGGPPVRIVRNLAMPRDQACRVTFMKPRAKANYSDLISKLAPGR